MRAWGTLFKKNRRIASASSSSDISDVSEALNDCLESIYKQLDISESVWVSKHARELSRFSRTKFYPADFVEPVNFDHLEIEFTMLDED